MRILLRLYKNGESLKNFEQSTHFRYNLGIPMGIYF